VIYFFINLDAWHFLNVKIIWHRNCSLFRFSAHKSSIYSGSLPSALLSYSTVSTIMCCGVFQRRNNNVKFIKSLCTYHFFIADSFLFTRYSVKFIKCNYSQPYFKVKNNIDEEKLYSVFEMWADLSRWWSLSKIWYLGSVLLSVYLF
jgi:hypothetical protein